MPVLQFPSTNHANRLRAILTVSVICRRVGRDNTIAKQDAPQLSHRGSSSPVRGVGLVCSHSKPILPPLPQPRAWVWKAVSMLENTDLHNTITLIRLIGWMQHTLVEVGAVPPVHVAWQRTLDYVRRLKVVPLS